MVFLKIISCLDFSQKIRHCDSFKFFLNFPRTFEKEEKHSNGEDIEDFKKGRIIANQLKFL